MLATKRSAGVTPEVNLRNPFHADKKHASKGYTLALKPGQMSPEVQNRVAVAPQKGLLPKKNLKIIQKPVGVLLFTMMFFEEICEYQSVFKDLIIIVFQ